MGKTLRLMHTSKAIGYGKLSKGIPEFETFEDWINKDEKNVRSINETKALNLLNDVDHGSITRAREILIEYIKTDPRSSYCHLDFAPENIFATSPITPFDPNPAFNHPYIDLALAIVIATSRCGPSDAAHQIIEGYFAGEEYSKQALHAAILRVTYSKFVYWSKTDQPKRLAWLQEYLNTNKKDLQNGSLVIALPPQYAFQESSFSAATNANDNTVTFAVPLIWVNATMELHDYTLSIYVNLHQNGNFSVLFCLGSADVNDQREVCFLRNHIGAIF